MLLARRRGTHVRFRVAFNRLYDDERGVAYGGPALARRNLGALDAFIALKGRAGRLVCRLRDIHSGRRMTIRFARGGKRADSHLFSAARECTGLLASRPAAALHELVLHPENGLIAWISRW